MHTYTPAGLPQLVRVLVGSLAEGPEAPASDAASSALIANVVLSLAHVALDGGAAIALVAIPGTLPALASLMRPAPEGAVGGWSAVRGNAVTALLHLLHVAEGKAAMVPRESDETASAPAVAEGEEGVEEGAYEGEEGVEGGGGEDGASDPKAATPPPPIAVLVEVLSGALPTPAPAAEEGADPAEEPPLPTAPGRWTRI